MPLHPHRLCTLAAVLAAALCTAFGTVAAHPSHDTDTPAGTVTCTVTCIGMDGEQVPCGATGPCVDTYTLIEAAMPYATRSDLVARFDADEIDDLAPVDDHGASPRADAALADAQAEVDAALAECYGLPLDGTAEYPLLKAVTCDVARARLYDDAAPKRVLKRVSSARARLARIVAGELHVVTAAGARVPRLPRVLIDAGEPIATRERLAGYLGPAPASGWC